MIEPHRIAGQFFNRPLLLAPDAARTIGAFLLSRFDARRGGGGENESGQSVQAFRATGNADGSVEIHSPRASRFVGEYRTGPDGRPTSYRVTQDGTAIITIVGELVNRGAWVGASSGVVSYEGVKHQVGAAAKDPQVTAILLDIESPGGEAVGAFEVADVVRKARDVKPVIAVVNGLAASAAYAIASGSTRIITPPTGIAGSIGVVMMHLDMSEYLATEGLRPTLVFAGDHKVDGNPFEPLPEDVRADFQREIDAFYGLFVQTVAAGRGRRMPEKAVRDTQARTYMGAEAVSVGLADAVMSFEEVVSALADPAKRTAVTGGNSRSPFGGPISAESNRSAKAMTDTETTIEATEAPAPVTTAPAMTVAAAFAQATAPAAPATPAAAVGSISRDEAAEIVAISAQAARLGITVDAADAIAKGIAPSALRKSVLESAAARDEATAVVSTNPVPPASAAGPATPKSGASIVSAAKAQADRSASRRA